MVFFVITRVLIEIRKSQSLENIILKKYILTHEVIVDNYCDKCTRVFCSP